MGAVVACKQQDPPVPTVPSSQTPTSIPESQPEPTPESDLTTPPEPEIPAHYTTYTSNESLFSISYPPEWEIITLSIEEVKKAIQEIISDSDMDTSMENALQKISIVFLAGLPTEHGYDPNMNIIVEPIPIYLRMPNILVNANLTNMKNLYQDYYLHSLTDVVVNGTEATIIEWESTIDGVKTYCMQLIMLKGKNGWYVSCTSIDKNIYEEYKDDFHHIVGSLRIYK